MDATHEVDKNKLREQKRERDRERDENVLNQLTVVYDH